MASEENETTRLLNNQNTHGRIRNHWLRSAAFAADLGKFIFGYAMVFPSALIPQLEEDDDPHLHLNIDQISWFGSIFVFGAILGGLSAMMTNDMIGRKHSIMMSVIPSTAGFFMMATAKEWLLLLLGRFFTGIAGGIAASSIPVYLSEISHQDVRGHLGSGSQIMTDIGGLALYALGLVLPWRWLAIAGKVPGLLMVLLLCFMPNSPRYLITKGKRDEAARALQRLRGPDANYNHELDQIERSINAQAGMQWSDCKPIFISVSMRFLQQMTGITPILIFLEPIFEKTAVSPKPKYDAAIVGLVRLVTIMIAACLIEKAGRKSLLFISAFIMYLATLTMTIYTHKTSCDSGNVTAEVMSAKESFGVMSHFEINSGTLIPLVSIIFIVLGYAVGWGPITCLLMSEILPMRVRGVTSGMCVMVNYITVVFLTGFFMEAVNEFGLFAPFLFFSVICVLNIIFTAVFVPETKGRTLEEMETYFRTGGSFTDPGSWPYLNEEET